MFEGHVPNLNFYEQNLLKEKRAVVLVIESVFFDTPDLTTGLWTECLGVDIIDCGKITLPGPGVEPATLIGG